MEATLEQFIPIIHISKTNIEHVHPFFKDTKALINVEIPFPSYGKIYRRLREVDYPYC
jgi:hypothetical protein